MDDREKSSTFDALNDLRHFKFRLALEGALVGVFSGCIIGLYRFCLEEIDGHRSMLYTFLKDASPLYLVGWIVVLLHMAGAANWLVNFAPMSGGSGIPQIKGNILGVYKTNWWRIIVAKILSCVMAVGAGLSLGREGPSIQLGGMAGQGVSRMLGRNRMEERCLISSGAGAGLAAAFNAPMAAVLFTMEVIHRTLSPIVLLPTLVAALTSTLVAHVIFGRSTIFAIPVMELVEFKALPQIMLLGVVLGFAGVTFNKVMLNSGRLYPASIFKNNVVKFFFPMLLTIPLGFYLPQILGGGDAIVATLVYGKEPVAFLGFLLLAKLAFTAISAGCGIPGGTLQPMLVMGALCGYIYANVMVSLGLLAEIYVVHCIVFAMAGIFAASIRSPLTGIILVLELTGSFRHLVPLSIVTLFAYSIAEFCHSQPIYDELLHRALNKDRNNPNVMVEPSTRNITEIPIESGSVADGKMICRIAWPGNALVVAVKRGDHDIIPRGDTRLMAGDYIYVIAENKDSAEVRNLMVRI